MMSQSSSDWPYLKLEFDALGTHGLTYFLPTSTGYFFHRRTKAESAEVFPFLLEAKDLKSAEIRFGKPLADDTKLPKAISFDGVPELGSYVFIDFAGFGSELYIIHKIERLN